MIGAPFYVMERVDGTPYRTRAQLEELGPERTAAIAGRMVDVLAALHAVDPAAVGLGEFGRPAGFLERQVRRWGRQLEGSRRPRACRTPTSCSAGWPSDVPADEPAVRSCTATTGSTTCWSADDRVRAVVDWEMATLGDPLTDVALLLVYDRLAALAGGSGGRRRQPAPGYPDPDEQLRRYVEASGRDLDRWGSTPAWPTSSSR